MKDIRGDFPQLKRKINGKRLVYLDSSATSLKPRQVIRKEQEYYTIYCANVFRGIYKTSEEATQQFEDARKKLAVFIGANEAAEVIFTRNTSESINLFAACIRKTLNQGDEVVMTIMEHHSNFVPWQQRAIKKDIQFRIWYIDEGGKLDLKDLEKLITHKTKVLAVAAVSNVLGTIIPIRHICHIVKKINPDCLVLVDAAQAAPHMKMNVQDWGADFVAFSSHKMLGPTGVGVLWGRREVLEQLSPYQFGGDMI